MTTESQNAQVLAWLKSKEGKKGLTPLDALRRFGCWRLGARIYNLRSMGHRIETEWETDGHKRWARYVLLKTAA